MNKMLREITTELFDKIEENNKRKFGIKKGNYEVYYNPEKELVNHLVTEKSLPDTAKVEEFLEKFGKTF